MSKKMKCMFLAFCNTSMVKDTWNVSHIGLCPHYNSFEKSYKYLYNKPMWLIDELIAWTTDDAGNARYVFSINNQPLTLEFFADHAEEINLIHFAY